MLKLFATALIAVMIFISIISILNHSKTNSSITEVKENVNERFIIEQSFIKNGFNLYVIKDKETSNLYLVTPGGQILKVVEK